MAAVGFVALAGSFVTASCRDVVAGDADDVLVKLCDTLKPCYGGDPTVITCADLESRWAATDAATASSFLSFVNADCFDTCPHALGCTDHAPFCLDRGTCDGRSDCCGWSLGKLDCQALNADDGPTCCISEGRPCDPMADDCCNQDCRGADGAYFCGGSACTEVGETCTSSFDCCTNRCVHGACEKLTECSRQDEPCGNDSDCCTDTNVGANAQSKTLGCDLESHTCRPAAACGSGDSCDPADSCCGDDLRCYPLAIGGVCGDPSCVPVDADCESDLDCCGTSVCNYAPTPHCQLSPNLDGMCLKTGGDCSGPTPAGAPGKCCSLSCDPDGRCREFSEAPCGSPTTCHSPCSVGGPMSTSCASDPTISGCIDMVVTDDPVCACEIWDATCVAEYLAKPMCSCAAASP